MDVDVDPYWGLKRLNHGSKPEVRRFTAMLPRSRIFLAADGAESCFFFLPTAPSPGFRALFLPFRRGVQYASCGDLVSSPLPFVPFPSCFSSMSTSTPSIEVEVSPGYQVPSYFYLLKNFDSIYASGLFCHIAKIGKKRDQQLRLIWAVEQMLGKLREVREENLQLRSPFFHAKRYGPPFLHIPLQTIN